MIDPRVYLNILHLVMEIVNELRLLPSELQNIFHIHIIYLIKNSIMGYLSQPKVKIEVKPPTLIYLRLISLTAQLVANIKAMDYHYQRQLIVKVPQLIKANLIYQPASDEYYLQEILKFANVKFPNKKGKKVDILMSDARINTLIYLPYNVLLLRKFVHDENVQKKSDHRDISLYFILAGIFNLRESNLAMSLYGFKFEFSDLRRFRERLHKTMQSIFMTSLLHVAYCKRSNMNFTFGKLLKITNLKYAQIANLFGMFALPSRHVKKELRPNYLMEQFLLMNYACKNYAEILEANPHLEYGNHSMHRADIISPDQAI